MNEIEIFSNSQTVKLVVNKDLLYARGGFGLGLVEVSVVDGDRRATASLDVRLNKDGTPRFRLSYNRKGTAHVKAVSPTYLAKRV